MIKYDPSAIEEYYYICDMCETDDGREVLSFKSLPGRKGHFSICLSCISDLYLKHISPFDKKDESITVKRKSISEHKRNSIFKRDGYKCVKCGSTENLTIDHIIPFSVGGKTCNKNLQTLCKSCNSKKGIKI